ncbi:GntR family transcriptional regulator [Pontibacter ummariensis]|uniref:Transcriptional regulator, GntR family n=1 Tax=Pontibacter ummariensis TaxID=1610492 RepID=A0A239LK29_9BACT|nr:GntR family transcriptional regulator [Pontibacter ummariensis]PRY03125.1 GntR family transcriptional regulator [Pontibacter ummariensis]SNT30163.1 transcriptional regulator, GntR family [Pontibacter ummariensis]
MYYPKISGACKVPKYKQILEAIIADIEKGVLKKDQQLPSINDLSAELWLGRDTVERAYRELKGQGIITSVQGKGNFVAASDAKKLKILLVFNKLSSYKRIIYYSFLKTLGDKAVVDLQIHHCDVKVFRDIIENNLGKYNNYVIMPHFFEDVDQNEYKQIIKSIPTEELVLLDKDVPSLNSKYLAVYQDFEKDIFKALQSALDLLNKYQKMTLIFPTDEHYPKEILNGFKYFCLCYNKNFSIINRLSEEAPQLGTVYIVIEESDLGGLLKQIKLSNFTPGKEVGIISFNDTTLKEILSVTIVTTDFEAMGSTAANLLLDKKQVKVKNSFYMIRRASL